MGATQANLLMAVPATVEIMTYVGINHGEFPHTFLQVTDVNGNKYDLGFAPQQPRQPFGSGEIFNDVNHKYTSGSGPITLTADQGIQLQQYINGSITTPPIYSIAGGSQCTVWALNGVLNALTGITITNPVSQNSPMSGALGVYIELLFNPITTVGLNTEIQLGRFFENALGGNLNLFGPSTSGNGTATNTTSNAITDIAGNVVGYEIKGVSIALFLEQPCRVAHALN